MNRIQRNSRQKCFKIVLVAGILCIIIAAALGLIIARRMVHPAQQVILTQNTSIVTTDKIGPQFVWLGNLSTRWYTSFDVKLYTGSITLLPMPVYAVPAIKLMPKGLATNLTCTCHAASKSCDIQQLPIYSAVPVKEFLYAGFHFIYNVCVSSSVSNAITLQAFIFEITNESDYNAFVNYSSTGKAISYLNRSNPVDVKRTTLTAQQTCVSLNQTIPRNAFYFAVTNVSLDSKKVPPILYMKECNAVLQFRDFSRTEYRSPSCMISDDQPCTSASVPGSNFIANTLYPQTIAILVNASQSYPVPTVLQVTATATNSNVFLFAVVMILIAAVLSMSSYALILCSCLYCGRKI